MSKLSESAVVNHHCRSEYSSAVSLFCLPRNLRIAEMSATNTRVATPAPKIISALLGMPLVPRHQIGARLKTKAEIIEASHGV